MAATAQGATFTFTSEAGTLAARATAVRVETPTAVVADMTPIDAPPEVIVLEPTKEWRGGAMTVDFILAAGTANPESFVRSVGMASLISPGFSWTKRAYLESASLDAQVGDVVKGSLKFVVTDSY